MGFFHATLPSAEADWLCCVDAPGALILYAWLAAWRFWETVKEQHGFNGRDCSCEQGLWEMHVPSTPAGSWCSRVDSPLLSKKVDKMWVAAQPGATPGCFLVVCLFCVLLNECFSLKILCLFMSQLVPWCFCSVATQAQPYGMRWCGCVGGWGDAFHPVPEKPRSSLCLELILMFVSDIFLLSFLKIGIEFWLFLGVIVSVFRTWLLLSQLSSRRTLL